jgi:hypothetical protein
VENNDQNKILWVGYSKLDPLRPARMNLTAIKSKNPLDIPSKELLGEEPLTPRSDLLGMKLWKAYNEYRINLVKLVGTYTMSGKAWSINPTAINSYNDYNDLTKQVEAMIDKSNCNRIEDKGILRDLYISLTKPETIKKENSSDKIPWLVETFNNTSLISAISALTALQTEVLEARAKALGHISCRVAQGIYSFNSIEAIATGPSIISQGDQGELRVMMAAFDSDNQPVITGGNNWYVSNGYGIMVLPTTKLGEQNISGTIKIKKKDGSWSERPWSYSYKVVEKE